MLSRTLSVQPSAAFLRPFPSRQSIIGPCTALGLAASVVGCGSWSDPELDAAASVDATQAAVVVETGNVSTTVSASSGPGSVVAVSAAAAVAMDSHEHMVPLFPAESDAVRQGFVRVINHTDEAGEVSIEAVDDDGNVRAITLTIDARQTVHFNSKDLEEGDPDKGLDGNTGSGTGDWRLQLASDLDIEVLAYIRTNDGFLTAMHDLVPETEEGYRVPTFNPGRNTNQVSQLRLINPGDVDATVTVHGIDDSGDRSHDVEAIVPAGAARTFSVQELEAGADGLTGRMDSGSGKWQLVVSADASVHVMSLLASPTGHLTNLSTVPVQDGDNFSVPMFPANSESGPQGFVRVINHGDVAGEVTIAAFDDDGTEYETLTLAIDAGQTRHFNSKDLEHLEDRNPDKGLTGSTGPGRGDWRLEISSDLDIEVLAYIRTTDGFLTAIHDTAPTAENRHRIAVFNPGRNVNQVSRLRLVNPGDASTTATIIGIDDRGDYADYDVRVTLPAGATRTLTARELEAAGFDEGQGKWQLVVQSPEPIMAMSLMATPTGHLTNLSTAPDRGAVFEDAEDAFEESVSQSVVQNNSLLSHKLSAEIQPKLHFRLVRRIGWWIQKPGQGTPVE